MYGIEKEMIEDYGVESSIWIGGKRIVLGINEENTEKPRYMSCIVPESLLPYVAKQTLEDIHHGFLTTDFEKKRGEER